MISVILVILTGITLAFGLVMLFSGSGKDQRTISRLALGEVIVWTVITVAVFATPWQLPNNEISMIETGCLMVLAVSLLFYYFTYYTETSRRLLHDTKARLGLMTEHSGEMYFVINPRGLMTEINNAVLRLSGYKREDLIGAPIRKFIDPEDYPKVYDRIIDAVKSGVTANQTVNLRLSSGELRRIDVRVSPVLRDGRTVELIAIARDLSTERRALSQAQFLATVITESRLPLMIFGDDGKVMVWNRGMESLTGFSRTQAIGRAYDDMLSDVPDLRLEAAAGDGTFSAELLLSTPKEDVPTLLTVWRVDIEIGTSAYAVYFQNLTRQRKLEEQLLHHQRMEALGKLAGGVAHDFNNVLTIISGNAAILKKRADLDEKFIPHLDGIIRSTRRGASLTEQLLTFSRRHPFTPKRMDLEVLIDDTVDLISHAGWSKIDFEVSIEPNVPPVMIDPGRIQQALMNLCVNARDAMPDGGTIALRATRVSFLDPHVLPRGVSAQPGTYVRLDVTDTGTGMDHDTVEHIFEPFFTTKGPSKGTGLGLANVHGIIQQHRGWLEVESAPGKGTTMTIMLPEASSYKEEDEEKDLDLPALEEMERHQQATPSESESESGDHLLGHETILLVDDEALVREVGKTALELYGYTVIAASEGREAIELYEVDRDKIDIVVLDWAMRDVSGREVLQKIREKDDKVPVLIQSGVWHVKQRDELIGQGANGLLTKPYLPETLIEEIRRLLHKPDVTEEVED